MARLLLLIFGLLVTALFLFFVRAELQRDRSPVTVPSQEQSLLQPDAPAGTSDQNSLVEPEQQTAGSNDAPAAASSPATSPVEVAPPQVLQPADPAQARGFGAAIDVWHDTVVIGAPEAGDGAGAVYVFQRDGDEWREMDRLTAADGAPNDAFGRAVAIYDQTILVGASGHDAAGFETGAAYVFQHDGEQWQQRQKLLPGSPQDVRFGWAVALDGQTAVVGAPNRSSQGEILNIGSATIFSVANWEQQARLTTGKRGGAVDNDLFGWSVAVGGTILAVGAYLSDAVYLYRLVNGQWQLESAQPAGIRGSQFGYSIALAEGLLVVGAPSANTAGIQSGAAFLLRQQGDEWQEMAVLAPEQLRPGSRFGTAVALSNDIVVVGVVQDEGNDELEGLGIAYLFQLGDGRASFIRELLVSDPSPFATFGQAIAVSDRFIFVGGAFFGVERWE